jgi:vitamin B12 transporter
MKQVAILLSLLLLAGWASAQVRITGTVKDNRGRILAGASVAVKGSYDGGVADSTGHFSFKTFEKGAQTLVASNVGYKSVETAVTIGTDY